MNSAFRTVCEQAAAAWDVPALAVGVSTGGGAAVTASGCDSGSIFRIASITKPFTALLALELLELDAQTGVWPADVRVTHLLSHTSGFDGEHGDLARFGDGDDALARLVAELTGQRRFLGVGEAWSYANAGYWLAGHLAAERGGCTYEEVLSRHVLEPLGLEATSFGPADVPGSGAGAIAGPYPRARRPSGGLASNVHDLLRFGEALLDSPHWPRLAVVRGTLPGRFYGHGLSGERLAGVEIWGHVGSWGGYQSTLLLVPARRAVLAGLTSSGSGRQALRDVENAWLEEVIGMRRPVADTVALPPGALEAFAGLYQNAGGRTAVHAAAGGLVLTTPEGDEHTARPIGETVFEITSGDAVRDRFDFPLPGFGRFGSSLAERVA